MGTLRRMAAVAVTALLLIGSSPAMADTTIDAQTNAARATYGLPALGTGAGLTTVAATRVQQITTNFSHPSSWQWLFDAIPGCESALGENIAWYTAGYEPAGWPVSAWMNSSTHKANILNTAWTLQGSARLTTNGRTYAVQLFSKPCTSTAPAPAPAPPIVDVLTDTSMSP